MELSVCSTQEGGVTLYFVIPKDLTEEKCTKILKQAFQACRENDLGPSWLTTEDCLKLEPTKQDVFIVDPLDGEAYNHLLSDSSKCVRVLGPRCLLTCLNEKRPVPELPSPLHNMTMHELVVTSTGFEKDEKSHLQQLVERMCGIYSNSFHEAITHLIAKVTGTKKYLVAIERETPIMTIDWVKTAWSLSNQESDYETSALHERFIQYTCPVFQGLVICVSQLPKAEKEALKSLIQKNGGTYSANLDMNLTSVLITPTSEGEKYKHALQWRIPCLTQDWVYDSIEQGHSRPVEDYKLLQKKSSTPTHDQSRALGCPPDVSICSTIMNESIVNRFVDETANLDPDMSMPHRRSQPTPDLNLLEGVTSLRSLNLQSEMKSELFLDGCKIFASGFDKSLNEKLRKLLNAGGASRFNTFNEAVSHVVVGKIVFEDMNRMEKWASKPLVVNAKWLTECAKAGRLVEEGPFLLAKEEANPPPPSLTSMMPPPPIRNTQINDTNNETFVDEDLVNQYRDPKDSSRRESLDRSTLPDSQEPAAASGLFRGRVFTVSGYDEQNEENLKELIEENGGVVVDVTSLRRPDYAIVSIEGTGVVPPKALNCITHVFIEDCLEQESLVDVEYYHLPFVWDSNCQILSDCVIATSMYKGRERQFISHIATELGAHHQDMFSKKDNASRGVRCSTHLLVPSPEGDKFSAARKWGVPAVSKDWLLKCALELKRVSEDDFDVKDSAPTELDPVHILLKILKRSQDGNQSLRTGTPVNKNIKSLQHDAAASIVTPDIETMRRMYPTPGVKSANDDSLAGMPTPSSPYGSTFYPNPDSRTRKAFKRAIDALPDDPVPLKKQRLPIETPEEVYLRKHIDNLEEFMEKHPPPKFPSQEEEAAKENSVPADHHGPLTGVVVYSSKKLLEQQQELYKTVADLGGDYRWTYDFSVTHLIHVGRQNDTNKEFRVARDQSNQLVAPDWVWMCRDENRRIDEALFPHTHNPKMSLSIVTTKSSAPRRRAGRSQATQPEPESEETMLEEEEVEQMEGNEKEEERVSKQLEELETLTKARRPSNPRNKSLSEKNRNTPIRIQSSDDNKHVPNSETESQSIGITWEDPQEREARARLEGALVGDTQDIIAKRESEENLEVVNEDETMTMFSFVLSGMNIDEREYCADVINRLGGSLCENQTSFDPSATHIITNKPSRSEKHLAAIASGKWLLYKSFLDEANERGKFGKEEEHEWGNPLAQCLPLLQPDSTEAKLAAACYRWRLNFLRTGQGAFHSMKVVFFTSKERATSFTRLFQAGGGTVLSHSEKESDSLTHCFVELNKAGSVDLALYAVRQIPCLLPVYLNEYLTSNPPPDAMESCIPEYKQIIVDMTQAEENFSLRRSRRKP